MLGIIQEDAEPGTNTLTLTHDKAARKIGLFWGQLKHKTLRRLLANFVRMGMLEVNIKEKRY